MCYICIEFETMWLLTNIINAGFKLDVEERNVSFPCKKFQDCSDHPEMCQCKEGICICPRPGQDLAKVFTNGLKSQNDIPLH